MSVFRIYAEKKPGYDVEARALLYELKNIFGISGLEKIRLLCRYDAENIDSTCFEAAKRAVFSEPQLDYIYSTLPADSDCKIAVEYLPGQFDQRADSCAQCLQMLSGGEKPVVRSARVYLLYGKLSPDDITTIKRHLINPVESTEASEKLPDTLIIDYQQPDPVQILNDFNTLTDEELPGYCKKYALAMDKDDLAFCRDYFVKEGRNPTLTELRVIDTYWSDHCRHTTFLTHLDDVKIDDNYISETYKTYLEYKDKLGRSARPVTLMEIATIAARILKEEGHLQALDESEEVNACSVKIKVDEDGTETDWLLMFKNETHNHPTEIEPFGGAATCIGGAIRDPLSGRSYVYQAMRVTGSGDPTVPVNETISGKLPQRVITTKAARGYSSYGNQIGLATGLVREVYHPGYIAKRMEVGAVIGAVPQSSVVREKPASGDVIILLGGRTGRDGCGGATGSSKSHNVDSLAGCGAEVQKGNAPEERKIQRLFRNPKLTRMIKRCNDFGAGGVAVAVGELADGLCINLDAVPKKYSGLDGTELAISESQERMAVVVSPGDVKTFIATANEENLEATVIAEVTAQPRLVMKWCGQTIVDMKREFLDTNGTEKHTTAEIPSNSAPQDQAINSEPHNQGIFSKEGTRCYRAQRGLQRGVICNNAKDYLKTILSDLNVCSQKGLVETFDSTIGAATVLMPFGGKYQMTPAQTMAAKIPVRGKNTETCSLMTYAFYPEISAANPYVGAYLAVAASIAKIIAAGGSKDRCWLSFQEYFERLGNDPKRWGKPLAALLGAFRAQIDIKVAAIGGKDSMSGSFEALDVPPTLISFAVSTAKVSNIISGEFKKSGSDVVLMAPEYDENGIPHKNSLIEVFSRTEKLIADKKVLSAYVIEAGGIGEALFKMTVGNRIGFEFTNSAGDTSAYVPPIDTQNLTGSILLEIEPLQPQDYAPGVLLGKTTSDFCIKINNETVDCAGLQEIYETRLESVFPTRAEISQETTPDTFKLSIINNQLSTNDNNKSSPAIKTCKPRVLIPVFPGTNCEYDTEKAFIAAGAEVEMTVIKNLTVNDIKWSINVLSDAINNAQIIALPGGFSGGDEPEGSAKFIISLFRNPHIKDAVHNLLSNRDGLMCGICNGFQALIKLGLVPYGEITDTDDNCATLTFNTIGRHQSMLVNTRIASNKSPWLCNTKEGDIHTVAISHGEGRFVAPMPLIEELSKNGQIATQYADFDGNPSMDSRFNPNGSMLAIEGITSPDGRVFGKMGHNERSGKDLFKNVPQAGIEINNPLSIFTSAVNYFR